MLSKDLYEVICVDDCSTDNTREWLALQQKQYDNLRVLYNAENIRQGGARNHGVAHACGKYIMFIDQDDYYHPYAIDKVYAHLQETELDILVNDSAYQFIGYESDKLQLNFKDTRVLTSEEFIQAHWWTIAPWRLTINRHYYVKHQFRFEEKCRIEDADWGVRVLFYAKRIQYFPHILVHYNKAETSTTDNMYRDSSILQDNTLAGTRVMALGKTLYAHSPLQDKVFQLAAVYYNYSVKYMFGLFASIKKKRNILNIIPLQYKAKYSRLVQIAITFPVCYALFSNITVPLFRIARWGHRKRQACKYKS